MANSLKDRDAKNIAAIQKLRFMPLSVTGGKGCYLIEEHGRRVLDLAGSWDERDERSLN
jgi:4-aminobutyrate aminotransferase